MLKLKNRNIIDKYIAIVVLAIAFGGCSVKVLTFGTDSETVKKEYFIGTKKEIK